MRVRPPVDLRLLAVVAALVALVASASLMAEAIETRPGADTLATYGYFDQPTRVDAERPTQADGTHEQALRGHAAPSGEWAQGYDDHSNVARGSARPSGYGSAPNTPGLIDDAAPVAGPPNRINSARVLIREAEEPGPFHNFPGSFDDAIYNQGTRTVVPGYFTKPRRRMGNNSIQYRLPGSINGRPGTYEIFTRPSLSGRTEVVQHRFFRPDPF